MRSGDGDAKRAVFVFFVGCLLLFECFGGGGGEGRVCVVDFGWWMLWWFVVRKGVRFGKFGRRRGLREEGLG